MGMNTAAVSRLNVTWEVGVSLDVNTCDTYVCVRVGGHTMLQPYVCVDWQCNVCLYATESVGILYDLVCRV